jgi:hypothetical protein
VNAIKRLTLERMHAEMGDSAPFCSLIYSALWERIKAFCRTLLGR